MMLASLPPSVVSRQPPAKSENPELGRSLRFGSREPECSGETFAAEASFGGRFV